MRSSLSSCSKTEKKRIWLLIEEQAGIVQSGFLLEKSQRQQSNLATQLWYQIFANFFTLQITETFSNVSEIFAALWNLYPYFPFHVFLNERKEFSSKKKNCETFILPEKGANFNHSIFFLPPIWKQEWKQWN